MKISGFTIIRNAVKNDYPVVESIRSVLPLVHEMIVLVGESEDATEDLIRSIGSEKIKIFHSVWNPEYFKGGRILAVETDKASTYIDPESDWALYIQADELIHEKYHPIILEAAEKYKTDKRIEGLLFNYLHFYGTYDYVGDSRKWYNKEIRIIRNDRSIHSYRDAQGFRKEGRKLKVKQVDAYIYHYGWVKSPKQMMEKNKNFIEFWSEEADKKAKYQAQDIFDFTEFDSLVPFTGTHPAVMQKRVSEQSWHIDLDISKKKFSFKNRLLYWIERKTGKRLFDYQNYELVG
jgi:hypothetical protein